MQIHELKRNTSVKAKRQVGRGGKRGKTSGRGTKGQKARSGRKIRPEIRDMIKKLPKLRGHGKNSNLSIKSKPAIVTLEALEENFENGALVSPKILAEKGLIRSRIGRLSLVKILADGELKKKLKISGCLFSVKAREKIEKAGSSIN